SISVDGGQPVKVVDGYNDHIVLSSDGRTLVFLRSSIASPEEVYTANADGSNMRQVTHTNDELMTGFNLRPAEEVTWTGAMGAKVSGWIVKPANFNANRRWPMVVLIHGGPQGAWNDNWGYRWNPEVFANAGYVVFTPNPRGSTGYGSRFMEDISGDWSGKVYTDIVNGVAHVISLGYVDRNHIGAAGGSYGGYMVDWIEGHNNDPRFQFKALVSHAGVYDLTSMYGATEELWFPEWEFHGTPWTNPEMYSRNSPHMFVRNFKTPLMVTHGEMDFRVPYTQGLELFTALQRQGIESRMLFFPDEGHWILKPQNSELWYTTVLQWFDKHLK
ncbi:MAG TPA: S9 family peptidase, partial [Pyrinomonadaceae bacterium]|nr:S9 family peptidase [Pyrinomonadaceae bacterium]